MPHVFFVYKWKYPIIPYFCLFWYNKIPSITPISSNCRIGQLLKCFLSVSEIACPLPSGFQSTSGVLTRPQVKQVSILEPGRLLEDPLLKQAENALVMMAMHEKEVYNLKPSHSVVIDDVWANNPTLGELYFMFGWQGHIFFAYTMRILGLY